MDWLDGRFEFNQQYNAVIRRAGHRQVNDSRISALGLCDQPVDTDSDVRARSDKKEKTDRRYCAES
jgi:hypothetical protein